MGEHERKSKIDNKTWISVTLPLDFWPTKQNIWFWWAFMSFAFMRKFSFSEKSHEMPSNTYMRYQWKKNIDFFLMLSRNDSGPESDSNFNVYIKYLHNTARYNWCNHFGAAYSKFYCRQFVVELFKILFWLANALLDFQLHYKKKNLNLKSKPKTKRIDLCI